MRPSGMPSSPAVAAIRGRLANTVPLKSARKEDCLLLFEDSLGPSGRRISNDASENLKMQDNERERD